MRASREGEVGCYEFPEAEGRRLAERGPSGAGAGGAVRARNSSEGEGLEEVRGSREGRYHRKKCYKNYKFKIEN